MSQLDDLLSLLRRAPIPKGLPFSVVMEAICGHRVIPFNPDSVPEDKELLDILKAAAIETGSLINAAGIRSTRVNEAGNAVEPILQRALKSLGITADRPQGSQSGKKKAVGYPDFFFLDRHGRPNYLEVKTYNSSSGSTSHRSFYLSLSDNFKISQDARHLGVAFELESLGSNLYKARAYKVLSLESVPVSLKFEFNASNKELYKVVIAEGRLL